MTGTGLKAWLLAAFFTNTLLPRPFGLASIWLTKGLPGSGCDGCAANPIIANHSRKLSTRRFTMVSPAAGNYAVPTKVVTKRRTYDLGPARYAGCDHPLR
jgi:hypothetical protein